ncbi:MAG: Gfo/Idh/MocA family oxidoreductase [Chryseolinea sp.]
MLKIGIIGLGDIAKKAYLPIITTRQVELHLYGRNLNAAKATAASYRLNHVHESLDSLLNVGLHAVFVHVATHAHFQIVERLLNQGLHVYVDKPVTDQLNTVSTLFDLAIKQNRLLHVGFNRRYAPAYANLKKVNEVSMIVMQKNRKALPGQIRAFIFDDFIHVVDTLLFLSPTKIRELVVHGKMKDGLLYHVMIQLISDLGVIATGIMNRESGAVEERLELFTPGGKWVVENVADTYHYQDKNITKYGQDDWASTLHKRGFEQIIDHFLTEVASGKVSAPDLNALETHRICEEIVTRLERT